MDRLDDIKKQRIINNAVELGLAGRGKSVVWPRKLAVVAASIIIGISVFGYTFPALAQHIPIIGGIFEREDLHGMQRFNSIGDLVGVVAISAESNGVTVTIEEAVFDGYSVYFTFAIDGIVADGRLAPVTSDFRMLVDGQEVEVDTELMVWVGEEDTFVGTGIIRSMERLEEVSAAEVTIYFTDFYAYDSEWELYSAATGNWDFRFSVDVVEYERVVVDQSSSREGFELIIDEIVLTPVTTRLYVSGVVPTGESPATFGDTLGLAIEGRWGLRDDLGNTYRSVTGGGGEVRGRYFNMWYTLEAIHPDASYLIVTPLGFINEWEPMVDEDGSEMLHEGEIVWHRISFERIELPQIIIPLP